MKATVGDRLVIRSRHVDQPDRQAEILEVPDPRGEPPFRVRWSDGHEAVVVPGPDAHVEPAAGG
jgi:hypothetical protein